MLSVVQINVYFLKSAEVYCLLSLAAERCREMIFCQYVCVSVHYQNISRKILIIHTENNHCILLQLVNFWSKSNYLWSLHLYNTNTSITQYITVYELWSKIWCGYSWESFTTPALSVKSHNISYVYNVVFQVWLKYFQFCNFKRWFSLQLWHAVI